MIFIFSTQLVRPFNCKPHIIYLKHENVLPLRFLTTFKKIKEFFNSLKVFLFLGWHETKVCQVY